MKISYRGTFGTWLADQLMMRKSTVRDFAKDIGISRQHIHKHLSGKTCPHKSTLRMYAKYFDEPYENLIKMVQRDWEDR